LRSAHDFDSYYRSPDPWKIDRASRRDRTLARIVGPYVAGKAVLELGCGEGHLTATTFRGIDISPVRYPGRPPFRFRMLRFKRQIFLMSVFLATMLSPLSNASTIFHQRSKRRFSKSWQANMPERSLSSQDRLSVQTNIEHISLMAT
jgi:hypothetical protein